MAKSQKDQLIDSQPGSGHLCFFQQMFEIPTKIIFAQLCSFLGMLHHLPNIFLPHVRGEVFYDLLKLR